MNNNETSREWRPGDGITCRYAKRAPRDIPCGKPTRTRVTQVSMGPRRGDRTVTTPLCANHADVGAAVPSKLRTLAEKAAKERLIAEHYEDFQRYQREEAARLVAERAS